MKLRVTATFLVLSLLPGPGQGVGPFSVFPQSSVPGLTPLRSTLRPIEPEQSEPLRHHLLSGLEEKEDEASRLREEASVLARDGYY